MSRGRGTYGFDFLENLICLCFGFDLGFFHLHHPLIVQCESRDQYMMHVMIARKTYSGEILPLAGDMSTEMSDRNGLFSSSLSARAMTAFPPLSVSSNLLSGVHKSY